jgi:hypothetical protein
MLGDLKRGMFDRPSTEATAHFNPSRRAVDEREGRPGSSDAPPLLELRPEDRSRLAALVAAARSGPCEVLGAAELAAVMSIEPQRVRIAPPQESRGPEVERVTAPVRREPVAASALQLAARPSVA